MKGKASPISSDETPSGVIRKVEEEVTQMSVGKHHKGVGEESMNGKFVRLLQMSGKKDASGKQGMVCDEAIGVAF